MVTTARPLFVTEIASVSLKEHIMGRKQCPSASKNAELLPPGLPLFTAGWEAGPSVNTALGNVSLS